MSKMFRSPFKNNLVTETKLLLATFYNKYERHSTVFWLPLYCSLKFSIEDKSSQSTVT